VKRALLDINVLLALLDSDHDGRLVTFDRSIPLDAVRGAREANLTFL
jgi:hypothetical protein